LRIKYKTCASSIGPNVGKLILWSIPVLQNAVLDCIKEVNLLLGGLCLLGRETQMAGSATADDG